MNKINREFGMNADNDLQRAIEPLASYICAAEHPRTTLASALKALYDEVKETNRAAVMHCGAFSRTC